MNPNDRLTVELRKVEQENQSINLHLTDDFFKNLEQEEIAGGDIEANISIRQAAGGIFRFDYRIAGSVRVLCDRCLEEVSLPVRCSETVKVSHGADDADDGETIAIPPSQTTYDMAWDIYEIIDVNLPLQRVHPEGQCNPDMLGRFSQEEDAGNGEDF